MSGTELAVLAGILGAISAVAERLVEIVKKFYVGLDKASTDEDEERKRQLKLLLLSWLMGILVIWATKTTLANLEALNDYLGCEAGPDKQVATIIVLGLMSAGGSNLWNSVGTYASKLKDLTKERARRERFQNDRLLSHSASTLQEPSEG